MNLLSFVEIAAFEEEISSGNQINIRIESENELYNISANNYKVIWFQFIKLGLLVISPYTKYLKSSLF